MTRGSATAVTMASCTRVETLARTAPARAARKVASPRRTRAAMTPVVAVPDTNPPARPATMSPRLAPSNRVATYPSQLMPVMSTTSSQMRCGTQTPYGPKLPSGRTGSRTKAATKNLRASTCSRWVTVSLTNRCNASRETRSTVMTTASATARVGLGRGQRAEAEDGDGGHLTGQSGITGHRPDVRRDDQEDGRRHEAGRDHGLDQRRQRAHQRHERHGPDPRAATVGLGTLTLGTDQETDGERDPDGLPDLEVGHVSSGRSVHDAAEVAPGPGRDLGPLLRDEQHRAVAVVDDGAHRRPQVAAERQQVVAPSQHEDVRDRRGVQQGIRGGCVLHLEACLRRGTPRGSRPRRAAAAAAPPLPSAPGRAGRRPGCRTRCAATRRAGPTGRSSAALPPRTPSAAAVPPRARPARRRSPGVAGCAWSTPRAPRRRGHRHGRRRR